jgi:hypothetical protein
MIWIQASQKEGHEMAVFKGFQQHLVNPGQNVIALQLDGSEVC